MSGSPLIYCVEDDDNIRELICYALKSGGYQAEGFAESGDFWRRMEESTPRLVLLDIMLPGEDGMQLLHKMKNDAAQRNIPVIMLTAKTTELDKVGRTIISQSPSACWSFCPGYGPCCAAASPPALRHCPAAK